MITSPPKTDASSFVALRRPLRAFLRDRRGNLAMIAALLMPVLCLSVAFAVETGQAVLLKSKLQDIADSHALMGAVQLASDRSDATPKRMQEAADAQAKEMAFGWTITTKATAAPDASSITVQQTAWRASFFGNLLPPGGFTVGVKSTALSMPGAPLCVLSQDMAAKTMSIEGASSLNADGCLVQSNGGMSATGSSKIRALKIQSGGGASGDIVPKAVTDAPAISDPFPTLTVDPPAGCLDTNLTFNYGTATINPGVHCGNVNIGGASTVTLAPGEHYFTGPSFVVGGSAILSGVDAVLLFKNNTKISFEGAAAVSLEGRRSGKYAGFLLVTDRLYTGIVSVSAQTAHKLFGTIYFPSAALVVSGASNQIADASQWTIIVARAIQVTGSSQLIVKSNYAGSSVPVPRNVGPNAGKAGVRLSQ